MKNSQKIALFSTDNKNNVVSFAIALIEMGWRIIATAETLEELRNHDVVVDDVAFFTGITDDYGFPPTLHPKIEAALTMDVDFKIDLVFDIPYGLDRGNDVGGRTLLALGAKGNRIVVFSPADMQRVVDELKRSLDYATISDEYRQQLIDKANAHIANHYLTLTHRDGKSLYGGWVGRSILRIKHGENPYQKPADLFTFENNDRFSLDKLKLQTQSLPCFTNLADIDCVLQTLSLSAEAFCLKYSKVPYIAVASKHGNPCGMAIDWEEPEETLVMALLGNPQAIWGGEFTTNFKIDQNLAKLLYKSQERKKLFGDAHWMLDVIVAPEFDGEALQILGRRKSRKIFANTALYNPEILDFAWQYRQVRGGFLRQPAPNYVLDTTETQWHSLPLEGQILDSLILAWSIVWTSNHGGNEVALVKDCQLLGVGGGPSTVEAARTALSRAQVSGHDTTNSVFAADAFFPFVDAPQILKEAGCIGGVVPSGGGKEAVIKKYFQDNNVNVIYIPTEFRGFCRH